MLAKPSGQAKGMPGRVMGRVGRTARCLLGTVWLERVERQEDPHSGLPVWPGTPAGFKQGLSPRGMLLAVGWWVGSIPEPGQESPHGGRVFVGGGRAASLCV